MRKLMTAAALAAGVLLAGCNVPTVTLQQIQQACQTGCNFLPTAVDIANVFPTPYTVPAEVIATAICGAVTAQVPASSRRRFAATGQDISIPVTLPDGTVVNVTGHFVAPAAHRYHRRME